MSYSTLTQVGDNIYVNVVFTGITTKIVPDLFLTPAPQPVAAEYAVTKTLPILSKCDDYYCSVIRFAIPLTSVPLFIMPIIPNQPDPNLTPFFIGISNTDGTINLFDFIKYVPEDLTILPPVQNQSTQVITPYYYVFDYQNLITAINTTLASVFISTGLSGNAPYFYLNTSTEEINLVVDIATFAPTATPTTPNPVPIATIFIDSYLQPYLSSFSFTYRFISPVDIGTVYQFNLVRFGLDTTIPSFDPTATQKQFSEEFSNLQLWSSLRKILITTNSIPIISEYTPGPFSNNGSINSGISSTLPIITDFIPQIELAGQSRSVAYYVPTSQYRLVDLKSSEQLNTIDLKIYWQDIQQNIYPLLIGQGQQASVKLGFFKKSLYNGSILPIKK